MNYKLKIKKICIILFPFTLVLLFAPTTHASVTKLIPSAKSVQIGEEFYIDVMLDPQNISINGIEGSLSFPTDIISFIRSENEKSLVSLWVEEPKQNGNSVSFAGMIPYGFKGVIDPFNTKQNIPGLMTHLIFKATKSGTASFYLSNPFSITLNDGTGTVLETETVNTSIEVENKKSNFEYTHENSNGPTLEAKIFNSPDFENKYVLIFQAKDSSGIKDVMIKEGSREWKKITSPYLLEDQSRHSLISVQAVSFGGGSVVIIIDPIPYTGYSPAHIALSLSLAIIIFIIIKKIMHHVKNSRNVKKTNNEN